MSQVEEPQTRPGPRARRHFGGRSPEDAEDFVSAKAGDFPLEIHRVSGFHVGLSENSVPNDPMVNDHYPY